MAVLLASVTGLSFSILNIIINLILLAAAFLCPGKSFGIRTVYVTLCTSVCFEVLEYISPVSAPLTTQPALEALVVVVSVAALAAELFQLDACSGGTDIVAMILQKYIKIDIGRAQAIKLRNFIHDNQPDAFLVITNTSEIVGQGFLLE